MHKSNQKTQSNECLICFQPLLQSLSFAHLIKPLPLCYDCLNKFAVLHQSIDFHHYPLTILYVYNDFFQTLLFQYKGLYDYALKDAFLCLYQEELKTHYHDYIVVVAPSSIDDNKIRGFAPVEAIAKTFSSSVFTGLYKKEKYKQSDLSYQERKSVNQKIDIKHGEELVDKKVLILDDVVTSGSTLSTCLSLVLKYKPQKVELLVLSTRNKQWIKNC